MTGVKRSWCVVGVATVVAALLVAPASSADEEAVIGTMQLEEGDELAVFTIDGNSLQGGHLDGWLNEFPGSDFSQIGGIPLYSLPDGCDNITCANRYVGFCSEAAVDLSMDPMPFSQEEIDGRLKYLTWKHDFEWYQANYLGGLVAPPLMATQALVWAWHSDPQTGSTVFSSVSGGFDDPFNWDGLISSAHDDPSPRVGFHSADVDVDYWDGTDEELLAAANQAVYDLAVEATAKAGPWTLAQGAGATGVVLTGANGPIEGETITFDDGSADGINIVTDANGYAAWPAGASTAKIEGPGATWRTPGPEDTGGQDVILTLGEDLVVNVDDPAPTTTTTTVAPTTTTTVTPTTTTVALEPPEQTTTTTTPATTTTVVASPLAVSPPAAPTPSTPTFTG